MTDYMHRHVHINLDGTVTATTTPWVAADFQQAIADKESEITTRRMREALLTSDGAAWMEAKEAEIAALRTAMYEVANG